MIQSIKDRLLGSPSRRTAVAGYLNLGIMLVINVLSLRMALHHLSDEQCGVWSGLSYSLGLFLLLDFGVSSASARMMMDPLQRKDKSEINSWWTVTVLVMVFQGGLLLVLGLVSQNIILTSFYKFPTSVLPDAKLLWCTMITAAAVKIPFQAYVSILFCQNRFYHMHIGSALSQIVNFVIFAILLKLGYGLKSYMAAFAFSIVVMAFWWLWMVRRSAVELKLQPLSFSKDKVRSLLGYSNHIFIANVATQVTVVVQTMIVSNLFGTAALNPFSVCSRSSSIVGQVLSRTSEAKVPRWWNLYIDGKGAVIAEELRILAYWFIPLIFFSSAGLLVFNRSFITVVFNRPDIYLGRLFDGTVVFLLIVQQTLKVSQFVFPMSRKTRGWAIVSVIDGLLSILFGYLFGKLWGQAGLLFGSALGSLVSSVPFTLIGLPKVLAASSVQLYRRVSADVAIGVGCLVPIWLLLFRDKEHGWFPSGAEWYGAAIVSLMGVWLLSRVVAAGLLTLPRWMRGMSPRLP